LSEDVCVGVAEGFLLGRGEVSVGFNILPAAPSFPF